MTTTTEQDVQDVLDVARERVALGAVALDEHFPDWLNLIDLDNLAMSDYAMCVAGQVGRGYDCNSDVGFTQNQAYYGLLAALDPSADLTRDGLDRVAVRYGFDYDSGSYDADDERWPSDNEPTYGTLATAWTELVTERRHGGTAPEAA